MHDPDGYLGRQPSENIMIKHTYLPTMLLCSTLLIACSEGRETNENKENKAETVFQEQIDSLDKARSVEDTLLKSNQQQRETIESQSR
jgi:hypothetical protein